MDSFVTDLKFGRKNKKNVPAVVGGMEDFMFEKIQEIIAQQLNMDASEIKPESTFKDDLGADSLDLFELVMALEDEYSVEIPSEDLENITTVQAIMDYLTAKGIEA